MKASKFSALLALAVLFAVPAFAAGNKASLEITRDTVIAGKRLSPGKYQLTWQGQGPDVDLSVTKGKEVVVTTPARLLDLPRASVTNAVNVKENPDGSATLSQIQISGKKYALELGEPSGQTDVASRVK
jgi:hypothetical protein